MTSQPKTANEFFALPVRPENPHIMCAGWAEDDTIMTMVDADGVGWMLAHDDQGTFRVMRR